jgi:ADP-ribose pyrophosphatase
MAQSGKNVLAEGKYLRLIKEGNWEYADRTRGLGAVAVIALTGDGKLILTEQYRVPIGNRVIDLPAGLVGDDPGAENEEYILAAQRELLEETGYQARSLKWLISGPTTSGMATEQVHFYLARGARQVGPGGGTEHEDIQVHLVPLARVTSWLRKQHRKGTAVDVKAFFAASWLAVSGGKASLR